MHGLDVVTLAFTPDSKYEFTPGTVPLRMEDGVDIGTATFETRGIVSADVADDSALAGLAMHGRGRVEFVPMDGYVLARLPAAMAVDL